MVCRSQCLATTITYVICHFTNDFLNLWCLAYSAPPHKNDLRKFFLYQVKRRNTRLPRVCSKHFLHSIYQCFWFTLNQSFPQYFIIHFNWIITYNKVLFWFKCSTYVVLWFIALNYDTLIVYIMLYIWLNVLTYSKWRLHDIELTTQNLPI